MSKSLIRGGIATGTTDVDDLDPDGTNAVFAAATGESIVFSLDTSVNTLGYNIANIATFSYWGDSRAMQEYTVSVSVVGDAGFTTLHALTGELGASGKVNQVTLTDNAGYLATGVDAIRFVFADIGSLNWVAYREIDVVGSAVPIP